MHFDGFFIVLRNGDSSRAYQIGFQDPATTTMEGIYLFNLHLLAVIIVRYRMVCYLTSVIWVNHNYMSDGLLKKRIKFLETIAVHFHEFTWVLRVYWVSLIKFRNIFLKNDLKMITLNRSFVFSIFCKKRKKFLDGILVRIQLQVIYNYMDDCI